MSSSCRASHIVIHVSPAMFSPSLRLLFFLHVLFILVCLFSCFLNMVRPPARATVRGVQLSRPHGHGFVDFGAGSVSVHFCLPCAPVHMPLLPGTVVVDVDVALCMLLAAVLHPMSLLSPWVI